MEKTSSNRNAQGNKGSDPKTNQTTSSLNNDSQQNSASASGHLSASNQPAATIESIKVMAETIGISNLNDEAAKEVVNDLTFTLKSIILDAQKFARRSRRKKLVQSDIDYSLKNRQIEPIYGFYSNDPIPFRCTTSTGGNASGRCIYYVDEQVVDLNDLISTNNSSVKIPNDLTINAHWLAIEGVQPSVPENPLLISREIQKKEAIEGASAVKSKEKTQRTQQDQKNMSGESLVKIKSLVPHDLSIEQQIYFKEITEACVGSDEQKRTEALNSLSTDPGLHQLLPRFILFISEGVRLNILQTNMAILIYLMRMAKALIENKSIYLEKYLHELLPSVFSCVLSKQLSARPEVENHYAIREFCARLVGQILTIYGPTLTFLQSRIVKVYLNSLESDKTTFATLFGAIVGVSELGDEICESVIFPLVKPLGDRIVQILDSPASNQEKLPAEKVKQEIIKIVVNILKSKSIQTSDEFDYLTTKFGAYFGQQIHTQLSKVRGQQQQPPLPTQSLIRSNNVVTNRTPVPAPKIITQTIIPKSQQLRTTTQTPQQQSTAFNPQPDTPQQQDTSKNLDISLNQSSMADDSKDSASDDWFYKND